MPIAKALKTNGVIVDSCRTLGKMTKPSALRVLESKNWPETDGRAFWGALTLAGRELERKSAR